MAEAKITALEGKLDQALKRLQRMEDESEIRKTQYKYGVSLPFAGLA